MILAIKTLDSGKYQDDLADHNLKGKVKSCVEFYYNSNSAGNDIDTDWNYKMVDSFSTKGNAILFKMSGNPSKKPFPESIYYSSIYDTDGKEIEIKDSSGQIISHSTYQKNKNNSLVEVVRSGSGTMLKIIYNRSGLRDTMYDYDVAGKFMYKVIYQYDKINNLRDKAEYTPEGKLTQKYIYSYDENKRRISEMRYDSLGTKHGKINYAYDDYGNITMETDSNTIYIGGNRVFDTDPNNKNIHIYRCSFSNFDSRHNWLRQDMFQNNAIAKTFKRKIEYYP